MFSFQKKKEEECWNDAQKKYLNVVLFLDYLVLLILNYFQDFKIVSCENAKTRSVECEKSEDGIFFRFS